MRHILIALVLTLAFVAPALAVDFEFDWPQTNTDGTTLTDLAGARVYVCPLSPCTKATGVKTGPDIAPPAADPPAAAVGIFSLTTGKGFVAVTAFDTSGNESAESNTRPFDAIAPQPPVLRTK